MGGMSCRLPRRAVALALFMIQLLASATPHAGAATPEGPHDRAGSVPPAAPGAPDAATRRRIAGLLELAAAEAAKVRFPTERAGAYRVVARAQVGAGDAAGARASLAAARES